MTEFQRRESEVQQRAERRIRLTTFYREPRCPALMRYSVKTDPRVQIPTGISNTLFPVLFVTYLHSNRVHRRLVLSAYRRQPVADHVDRFDVWGRELVSDIRQRKLKQFVCSCRFLKFRDVKLGVSTTGTLGPSCTIIHQLTILMNWQAINVDKHQTC